MHPTFGSPPEALPLRGAEAPGGLAPLGPMAGANRCPPRGAKPPRGPPCRAGPAGRRRNHEGGKALAPPPSAPLRGLRRRGGATPPAPIPQPHGGGAYGGGAKPPAPHPPSGEWGGGGAAPAPARSVGAGPPGCSRRAGRAVTQLLRRWAG